MIPPESLPPSESSPPPELLPARRERTWGYLDLALFTGLAAFSLFLLGLFSYALAGVPKLYATLIIQALFYAVALLSIAAILRLQHDLPFWRSLGWMRPNIGAAVGSFLLGILLAIGLNEIGILIRAKSNPLPFESQPLTLALQILFGVLVVVAGPIYEELVFRGFVMPVLIRSLGAAGGIVLTGALFGMLHAFEYSDWRIVLLVAMAGMAFGWRKYQTGSTVQSAFMHAGFNLLPFIGMLAR